MQLDRTLQWTLARPVTFEGVGLHSGARVTMTLLPAEPGEGIRFRRTDLPGTPAVPALADHVVETTLSTTLGLDGVRIGTVEHLMAALYVMGVCNVEVLVDSPELPIMDGSSIAYIEAIQEAGRVEQSAPRRILMIQDKLEVQRGDRSVIYQPTEGTEAELTCIVDYGHPHAGAQLFEGVLSEERFASDLASARTFCFLAEVEAMRKAGLAKGGTPENAVVIADDGPMTTLRYADECVRHKTLDLIGDLALCGFEWRGSVVAAKAGHPLHVALAQQLQRLSSRDRAKEEPVYAHHAR